MRNTVIAVGLFVCAYGILSTTNVSAAELHLATITESKESTQYSDVVASAISPVLAGDKTTLKTAAARKSDVKHAVVSGESLSTIAKKYDTTWRRLYDKNTKLSNPDVITTGQVLVIPRADEKLKHRDLPAVSSTTQRQVTSSQRQTTRASGTVTSIARGSSAGNAYYAGYCTWYAKSRRPDMPNNLGNADTWVVRAAAQGFATGSTPRAGAIGQQGMHVVYVERVNRNGTVTVSEMNYKGFGVVSSRTVPASTFRYIY
jgi:surface antigen